MSTKILFLLILTAALLAGCSKSATNNSPAASGNPSAATSNASPVGPAQKVGIAECDEFITKYEACISGHVPEAQKRQHQENINATARAWRQLANTGAKETLVLMCKRQVVQAQESMKEFNCQF